MAAKIDLKNGIDSLTHFKRQTNAFLKKLRKTGQPIALTINGKAELVVQEAGSYQRLLDLLDRLETIEGIKQALKDVKEGRTISLEDFKKMVRKKHGIPV